MNMNTQYSLVALLRQDPDFNERLSQKTTEVKKDKQNLLKLASEYNEKNHDFINQSTLKQAKMLSEGSAKGLKEEEVMKQVYSGGFLPTRSTPILNLLYFILRETEEIDRELSKQIDNERNTQNQQYGHLTDTDAETLSDNIRTPEDMFNYLYGHITIDTFNKLKKLKALTKSNEIEEASLAFQKCRELCKKYNIEYDRIPCNII